MTGFEMFWPMVAHAFLVFCLYALLVIRRAAVALGGVAAVPLRMDAVEDDPDRTAGILSAIFGWHERWRGPARDGGRWAIDNFSAITNVSIKV